MDESAATQNVDCTILTNLIEDFREVQKLQVLRAEAVEYCEIIDDKKSHENSRCAAQICLLPNLLPPPSKVTKTWKPTIPDSESSIIQFATTNDEVATLLSDRVKQAAAHNQTVQPFMIVVGPDWGNLTDFYTCVDQKLYKRDSAFECFDLLFKCFYVYDLEFPLESIIFWNIIGETLYQKKSSLQNPMLSTLLNDLNNHRKRRDDAKKEKQATVKLKKNRVKKVAMMEKQRKRKKKTGKRTTKKNNKRKTDEIDDEIVVVDNNKRRI